MAMTQAQIDALTAQLSALDLAIGSGALIVKHGEKEIRYQLASDMLAAKLALQRQLDGVAHPNRPMIRSLSANFSDE